jgi:ribosomal protein S12 methylthiotransferase accessory factor
MQPFSRRFLEVHDALVHPSLGIVRRIVDLPLQPDEAKLFIAAATCSDPLYFNDNRHPGTSGYRVVANGIGFTREECLWSVLGEACERYASGVCFVQELAVAPWDEVRATAIKLDDLIVFDDDQYGASWFPWKRLDPGAPMRWAEGRSLVDGAERLVPAFLVWMGLSPQLEGEHFLPQMSTGQGAGGTRDQAILAGLNEIIERDSFACAWLLAHTNFRVDNESLDALLDERTSALLKLPGLDAFVFDLATDLGVSCYLSMLRARRQNTIAVGASANLCHRTALTKAIIEAHHTRNWTIELEREASTVTMDEITDFKHHVLYYLNPESMRNLAFLVEARTQRFGGTASQSSVPERLRGTVELLARQGYEPVYVDTTPEDLRSIGIWTAKVLVPGLQPLHVGVGTEHRDLRRLRRVAEHWGLEWPRALNSEPHPFP